MTAVLTEKVYHNPEVYKIYVPLPENPLKNLNAYVIKAGGRNLLIDTGFNRLECLKALKAGLKELNIQMEDTDIFATHLHSDHVGLIPEMILENTTVYMSGMDYDYLNTNITGEHWACMDQQFHKEGFPLDRIEGLRKTNPARAFAPKEKFPVKKLYDGDKFQIGELEFTGVFTPGHTPGHMCLYLEKEQLIFLGDHVLFNITPNITAWQGVQDSLQNYIDSLKKIRSMPILTALPAHRGQTVSLKERIDEILEHHKYRLKNTLTAVQEHPEGINAYDVAGKLQWNMRGRGWEEFPDNQKWFAVGETLAHLDYLIYQGKIRKQEDQLSCKYFYLS